MFNVPEKFRITLQNCFVNGHNAISLASSSEDGNNGAFILPRPGKDGKYFLVIASCGAGWEHVSVTIISGEQRCPTWVEMCHIKDLFWSEEDSVVQFHPAKKDYVNQHPFCLHLWKPTTFTIPTPDPFLVGRK